MPSLPCVSSSQQVGRSLNSVELKWQVKHPQHGTDAISVCTVRRQEQIVFSVKPGWFTRPDSWWTATVEGLQSNQSYDFGISVTSTAGEGPVKWIRATTCTLPTAVQDLSQRDESETALTLTWRVGDPEAAPIERCVVRCGTEVLGEVRRPWGHEPRQRWSFALPKIAKHRQMIVAAVNAVGQGPAVSIVTQTLPRPTAPMDMMHVERGLESIRITWSIRDPQGAAVESCNIYLEHGRGAKDLVAKVTRSESISWMTGTWSATIPGLQASTVYTVSIGGVNSVGEGSHSRMQAGTIHRPAEVHLLQQTARTLKSVALRWKVSDPPEAPVQRCVIRSVQAGICFEVDRPVFHSAGGLWHADVTGLESNKTYMLTIAAANIAGEGPISSIQAATCSLPPRPLQLKQVGDFPTEFVLTWLVDDPTGAAVEKCNVWLGSTIATVVHRPWQHTADMFWKVSLSKPTKQERICIEAVNGVGEGPSSIILAPSLQCPATACRVLQVDRGVTSVTVSWTVTDPPGSPVHSCTVTCNGGGSKVVCRADAYSKITGRWSATVSGLKPCSEYDLEITALNYVGLSPPSCFRACTIVSPLAPLKLCQFGRSSTSVELSWQLEDPPSGKVSRCVVRSGMDILAEVSRSDAYHSMLGVWKTTIDGLRPCQEYVLGVSGTNIAGDGPIEHIQVGTLSVPGAPCAVSQTDRSLTSVTVQWRVDDPVAASVQHCLVSHRGAVVAQVSRPWFHSDKNFWSATVHDLSPSEKFELTVVAVNAEGESMAAEVCAGTLSCPVAIQDLSQADIDWIPHQSRVRLTWFATDPPGAPIQACLVYIGGNVVAEVPRPEHKPGMQRFAMQVEVARPCEASDLSVAARNVVGVGPAASIPAWTRHRPQQPCQVKQVDRSATTVSLRWRVCDPAEHRIDRCLVYCGSGLLTAVSRPHDLQDTDFWEVTLSGLSPSEGLCLALSAVNAIEEGPRTACTVHTSDAPEAPSLRQVDRSATSVSVELSVADPLGAPVEECLVWIEGRDAVKLPRSEIGLSTTFEGLLPTKSYKVHAKACNAVGGGRTKSVLAETSHCPTVPVVIQSSRSPKSISLQWAVADPLGALVTNCIVQLGGNRLQTVLRPAGRDAWHATVNNLDPSQTLEARVTAYNAAGSSPQGVLRVHTSTAPSPPCVEQIGRTPASVTLRWRIADSLGSPTQHCTVWLGGEIKCVVRRPQGQAPWTASIADLQHSESVLIGVTATNAVAEGLRGELEAHTSTLPSEATICQTGTSPHSARLKLSLADPEGSPVEACDVWLGKQRHSASRVLGSHCWSVEFCGLGCEKCFWVCAVARNSAGEGPESWFEMHTSTRPEAPEFVDATQCGATSATLCWSVEDPPGALVEKCVLKIRGQVLGEVHRPHGQTWQFRLTNLQPSRKTIVKICAVNEVGAGPTCNAEVLTSHPPKAPWIDQTSGDTTSVSFEWTVEDPVGAPVMSCEVKLGDQGIVTVYRSEGWKAHIKHLKLASKIPVSVTAINAAGRSRTKDYFVFTSRFDRSDGKVYTMFHGTSPEAARSIRAGGFRPSSGGMLGAGVYLSRDERKARAYGSVILMCRVSVGKVKCINSQGHPLQKSWQQHGYDTAWVPPNCGMVASGLEEDCIADPKRIQIIG